MKKLFYIDNDDVSRATKDAMIFVVPALMAYGGLDENYSKDIIVMPDFYRTEKDKAYDILFSKDNAILSWSVYTPTSFHDSKQQLLHFLRVAGSAHIKCATYIDVSGMIYDSLSKALIFEDIKKLMDILIAIETNNIITLKDGKFYRLNIELASEEIVFLTLINLKNILA